MAEHYLTTLLADLETLGLNEIKLRDYLPYYRTPKMLSRLC